MNHPEAVKHTTPTPDQFRTATERMRTVAVQFGTEIYETYRHLARLEAFKKFVFHGRDYPSASLARDGGLVEGHVLLEGRVAEAQALAGICGELAEVMRAAATETDECLLEEVGDMLFYIELLLQQRGLTLAQALSDNTRKILARYPDGFTLTPCKKSFASEPESPSNSASSSSDR